MHAIETAILRHLAPDASPRAQIPGLTVARLTEPLPPTPHLFEPSLCVSVRGEKRVSLDERTLVFDAEHFFLASLDVPTVIAVDHASPESPFVALALRLDLEAARLLMADMDAHRIAPLPVTDDGQGVLTAPITDELLEPLGRLLQLLHSPRDIPILAPLLQREILYRLLVGPQGARLRDIVRLESPSYQVAKAVRWLRENFTRTLRVEELAELAGMGVSTLHRHFRALTTMSPVQFQKQLRLHEARRLLLVDDLDAGIAAQRVGYESAAHFNHDYRRLFGRPPRRDVTYLRGEHS